MSVVSFTRVIELSSSFSLTTSGAPGTAVTSSASGVAPGETPKALPCDWTRLYLYGVPSVLTGSFVGSCEAAASATSARKTMGRIIYGVGVEVREG